MKVIKDLYTLDKKLKLSPQTYKNMRLTSIIAIASSTLVMSIILILEEVTFVLNDEITVEIGDNIAYCLPIVYTSYVLIQFCSILGIIKQRYHRLNQQIEEIAILCKEQMILYKCRIKAVNYSW